MSLFHIFVNKYFYFQEYMRNSMTAMSKSFIGLLVSV